MSDDSDTFEKSFDVLCEESVRLMDYLISFNLSETYDDINILLNGYKESIIEVRPSLPEERKASFSIFLKNQYWSLTDKEKDLLKFETDFIITRLKKINKELKEETERGSGDPSDFMLSKYFKAQFEFNFFNLHTNSSLYGTRRNNVEKVEKREARKTDELPEIEYLYLSTDIDGFFFSGTDGRISLNIQKSVFESLFSMKGTLFDSLKEGAPEKFKMAFHICKEFTELLKTVFS